MATKKHALETAPGNNPPSGKRSKVGPLFPITRKPVLNPLDCNLDFDIGSDGITGSALHNEGFAYCWSGARTNFGVKGGKYCFGCKIIENQPVIMEDTAKDQRNLCRVGLSRGDTDVGSLGESLNSFGYGGTGKFSHHGVFTSYGGPFGVGDTIVCAVDLENPFRAKICFAKNGTWLGVGLEFDAGPKGLGIIGAKDYNKAIFPHILLKNVKIRMMFSIDHGLQPLQGYKPWDAAVNDENAVEGPQAADGCDCEVIMMVGLPGSGKTTWAERWCREHLEKRYMLLGTNLALDQMKVPGLMRKKNYGERFERLMDRATKIFNQLMDRASKTSRNFIIDQTNVYRNARIRKLKPFRMFHKIAVVVFPHPEELKRRTRARAQQMGKEVPEDAVNEMLANFVLPNSKDMLNSLEPFDEVRFVELQRGDAERHLLEMKSVLTSKKHEHSHSFSVQGSAYDQSATQGSNAFRQGSYSSAYRLQELREPLHLLVPYQVACRSAPQVSYASTSQTYEINCNHSPYGPSLSHFQEHNNIPSRQLSREGSVPSYGGLRRDFPTADYCARETSVISSYDDRLGYSRDSSLPSRYGIHASPCGVPLQVSYQPGSSGMNVPAQSLHLTPLAGGYPRVFAGNESSHYGDPYLSASRAGQAMLPRRY